MSHHINISVVTLLLYLSPSRTPLLPIILPLSYTPVALALNACCYLFSHSPNPSRVYKSTVFVVRPFQMTKENKS